jgi:hypothetical protein
MAGYVQIIECESSRIGEMQALSEKMREERGEGAVQFTRTITEDRARPGHYVIFVEFDSYEDAVRNSEDPVTRKYGAQMGALLSGEPTFYDLDVVPKMKL